MPKIATTAPEIATAAPTPTPEIQKPTVDPKIQNPTPEIGGQMPKVQEITIDSIVNSDNDRFPAGNSNPPPEPASAPETTEQPVTEAAIDLSPATPEAASAAEEPIAPSRTI